MARKPAFSRISPIQRHAFEFYAFDARYSVRRSCALAGIAKGTGLALHRAIRDRMCGR
jgi:hypothetical protein